MAPVKKKPQKKKKKPPPPPDPVEELLTKQISFENGLDRCASLLAAMLETPTTTTANIGTDTATAAAAAVNGNTKIPARRRSLQGRRVISASTPVDGGGVVDKMNLPTAVSQIMAGGGDVSDAGTIDELIEEKELLQHYLAKMVQRSAIIEKQFQNEPLSNNGDGGGLSDIDQNSDVTRDVDGPGGPIEAVMQRLPKEGSLLIYQGQNGGVESQGGDSAVGASSDTDRSELVSLLESITSKLRVDEVAPGMTANSKCPTSSSFEKNSLGSLEKPPVSNKPVIVSNENTTAEMKSFSRDPTTECQLLPPSAPSAGCDVEIEEAVPTAVATVADVSEKEEEPVMIQDIDAADLSHRMDHVHNRYNKIFQEYQDNLSSRLLVSLGKSSLSSSLDTTLCA